MSVKEHKVKNACRYKMPTQDCSARGSRKENVNEEQQQNQEQPQIKTQQQNEGQKWNEDTTSRWRSKTKNITKTSLEVLPSKVPSLRVFDF